MRCTNPSKVISLSLGWANSSRLEKEVLTQKFPVRQSFVKIDAYHTAFARMLVDQGQIESVVVLLFHS